MEVSLVVASASLAIAVVALIIAWGTFRATREAPRETEAMKRHTDQVRDRLPEWVKMAPVLPAKDSSHHHPFNNHRKAGLWGDWLFVDVITHHPPGGYGDVERGWDRFIALEKEWSEKLEALARKLEPFIQEHLGLTRPPAREWVDWNGEVREEEDELAVDVYGGALLDLLVAELFIERIRRAFTDSDAPWWDPPFREEASTIHVEQGYADDAREAPLEFQWGSGKNPTVLATVSRENTKKARSLVSRKFVETLHATFDTDARELSRIHDEMKDIQTAMKQRLEKIQLWPLLPGKKPCPHVKGVLAG